MTPRPPAAALLAAALGLVLAGCSGSLYDAAGVPKVAGGDQCSATQHLCPATGNVCQAHDVDHCGQACDVCTAPHAAATASCQPVGGDHQCDFSCAAGWFKAGGTCQRASTAPGALASGAEHSCTVTEGGALLCWGRNDDGQLGVAGAVGQTPVVALASGVTAVTAGGKHTCALQAGVVVCFGANGAGQLGRAGTGAAPAAITGGPADVVALAAGTNHTCALTGGGAVHCWGANDLGQGGLAVTPGAQAPGLPAISAGVTLVRAAGDTTCALVSGQARCWGGNRSGQLGTNDTAARATPTPVQGLPGTVENLAVGGVADGVAGGASHACAHVAGLSGGSGLNGLWCWGGNGFKQLGDGGAVAGPALQPIQGVQLDNGQRHDGFLAAGGYHTCSSRAAEPLTLKCAGRNDQLQAGRVPPPPANQEIIDVSPGGVMLAVTAGLAHTCALVDVSATATPEPEVRCWGANDRGQLGRATAPARTPSGDPVVVGP